jgi:YVTN family beta-propeller protein
MRQLGLLATLAILGGSHALSGFAGQVPGPASAPDIPITHRDRVYAAEQFSNTVSVIDPADNRLLGVIRLGEPQPANFTPLYRGQLLVHGMGVSPDHRTLAIVSIGSNSVSFIDTRTNQVKHVTYVGRAPHEAFFTADGTEVWVTIRGENYVQILDATTYEAKARIVTPNGPGMTIFSPDGRLAYVCSSFVAETDVFDTHTRQLVGKVVQPSPFCPNIAASPDGTQVWLTLKDTGKVLVFGAQPPFAILKTIDTGPITNHVNFVNRPEGQFAYISIGGLNEVQVYRTSDFVKVATIPVGKLPHGVWPSGDGSRLYVGLENADRMAAIDTRTNRLLQEVPIGQAPQAILYVPEAVDDHDAAPNLMPLGAAASAIHLELRSLAPDARARTSVSLFDQGLVQVLQAAVTGLTPKAPYVLALAPHADGSGPLEPLAAFNTNAAGAAIVNAAGPIRQLMHVGTEATSRYLVVAPGTGDHPSAAVQVQAP